MRAPTAAALGPALPCLLLACLLACLPVARAAAQTPAAPEPSAAGAPPTIWIHFVEPADRDDEAAAGEEPSRGNLAAAPRRRLPEVFGCGDRLVALAIALPQGEGGAGQASEPAAPLSPEERVTLALGAQIAAADEDAPPGLLDALARTSLVVVSVEPVPEQGTAAATGGGAEGPQGAGGAAATDPPGGGAYRVRLTGRLEITGACDVPRLRAQLAATATQFDDVDEVELFLGDEPLDAVLSLRGLAAGPR